MRTVINIFRWFFGIIFCIAALGAITRGEVAVVIVTGVIGLFLLPPVTKFLFRKGETKPDNSLGLFSNFSRCDKLLKKIDCSGDTDIVANIEDVLKAEPKPLLQKQKVKLGKLIYLKSLDCILEDLKISDEEKKRLEQIKNYFSFTDEEIKALHAQRNQKAVQVLLSKKYDDRKLTDSERNEIIAFASFLNIDEATIETIRRNIAHAVFSSELNKILTNKIISPSDETHLKQLMATLELGDNIQKIGLPQKTINKIISYKKIWRADNGYLLPMGGVQIGLQRNEECYLMFPAKLVRSETITTGYKNISHGYSMRITNGLRYRAGVGYSMPVKENVTVTNAGEIYLTDRRIIFIGGSESFDINFANGKLLSFEAYSNGIDFIISGWVYTIKFGTFLENLFSDNEMVDLFCSSLSSCLRYIQNPEDPIYHEAVKEVEENEELIEV